MGGILFQVAINAVTFAFGFTLVYLVYKEGWKLFDKLLLEIFASIGAGVVCGLLLKAFGG